MQLALSLFPGIDLLGRAFRAAGFCVVTGPDLITGGDVREFAGVPGRFDGVFGGSPCQGFSAANRHRSDPDHPSVRNSQAMLGHFCRIVSECEPAWFLLENVPAVPDIAVEGYTVQRLAISDYECGGVQVRNRHIQYGSREGLIIRPERLRDGVNPRGRDLNGTTTTKAELPYAEHCRSQGFEPIRLPGWYRLAKYRAVGNGVPFKMGLTLAKAVLAATAPEPDDCPCLCGRKLTGRQKAATVTCRKRLQLRRDAARAQ